MLPRKASVKGWHPVIAVRGLALVAVSAALVAAACGDDEGADSDGDAPADSTALTIALDPDGPDGREPDVTEDISCENGSNEVACEAVEALDFSELAPPPPDTACTEIFGGPDTAVIQGVVDGEDVAVDLSRSNGCEIARFDAALPLLQALWPDYEPGASLRP